MAQAYTTDDASPGKLAAADEVRETKRKRWFERVVVLPVSVGMLAAAAFTATQAVSYIALGDENPLSQWFKGTEAYATGIIAVLLFISAWVINRSFK